ncbi:MAG: hypothetical protein JO247_15615, partial [Chloroflexi bacterium]|nr:hypothetical protein [Chloroflexota bacterium]
MDGPTRVTAFKPRYAVRERGKRRAAGLAETESRILGAARKLLCEEGFYGMALLR